VINLTKPDVEWLVKQDNVIQWIYTNYPELFSEEQEEILRITSELIRSLNT